MDRNLVFDVGFHKGEDSEFYLKKGFRVVGVEANPQLCLEAREQFREQIETGQLVIVNKAISDKPGRLTFYISSGNSAWGTVNAEWVHRNRRRHHVDSKEMEVEATTIAALVEEFGTPYYAKIDIEGNDLLAVEGFSGLSDRPKYISIESDKDSFRALRREISVLSSLGFDRFKIVDQRFEVRRQRPPHPAKEGGYVAHQFKPDASGLFGEELPGTWITADEAIEAYRSIFLRYALTGDEPFVKNPLMRNLLRAVGFRTAWYDTHARRAA